MPSGFLIAALYAALSRPTLASLAAGLPLALAGLLLRAWAAGHLAKNQTLTTSGPFAYTRNPLYAGSLAAAAGFALAGRSWWPAVVFAVYFLLVYWPAIGEEESHLRQLFPEYAAYAARVPRLLPRVRAESAAGAPFRFSLYLRNREYQALAAGLAAAALLLLKLPR